MDIRNYVEIKKNCKFAVTKFKTSSFYRQLYTMNTYLKISVITMIVGIIVEKNGLSEQEAITAFYFSKTARKLSDENILLRQMSPYLIYELWNAERQTGNYKASPYIAALL
jgi:hypothetical protein